MGKTTLVRDFASTYKHTITLNLEKRDYPSFGYTGVDFAATANG
ncbi:hypothetical protein [Parapedobacter sp.]